MQTVTRLGVVDKVNVDEAEAVRPARRRPAPIAGVVGTLLASSPIGSIAARTGSVGLAALLVLAPMHLAAQDPPPDGRWVTRTTEHFRVTHPEHLPEVGRRAAERAEAAFERLSEVLVAPPDGRVDVVVSDHADAANGFAEVFPTNRVVVLTPPPTDGLSLAYFDDWLDLVLIHELAHIFHLDEARGPAAVARALFGRAPSPWPWFPGLTTPSWTREGLATWYESALTGAGRHYGTYLEMIVRTAVLEDAFEELDQVSGRSPVWPHGDRPYAYGTKFLGYLLDRYGEERTGDFVRSVAGQWIPYRLNSAADDAFGIDFGDAWSDWRAHLEERVESLVDTLRRRAPPTRPDALTRHGRFALRPAPSPDGGTLAYARADGRNQRRIHLLDLAGGEDRGLTRTNGLADLAWGPDGGIVFAQFEFTDRYRIRSDLHRVDPGGRVRRLTRDRRLDQPDVAPDGSLVAVQNERGSTRLVTLEADGGEPRPLTDLRDDVHWAYPRVSPDGRWIAASRWSDGSVDVVLLDREGRLVRQITGDRALDIAPAWSPDGRWLVWASDRSGIWNVFAAEVDPTTADPEAVRQLTNVLTGVAYPAVGAEGRWLYVSGYHADGWAVERIPFEPERGFEPFPLAQGYRADGSGPSPPASRGRRDGAPAGTGAAAPSTPAPAGSLGSQAEPTVPDPEPYSALPTLLPRYWLPEFLPGEEALAVVDDRVLRPDVLPWAVGASTSGRDVLGRHAYGVRAVVAPETGRFEGSVDYRYAGLGNPALGLSARQVWEASSFGVVASDDDGAVPLFPVRRRRAVGGTLELVRRRFRHSVGIQLGAGFLREEEWLHTPDGEPSQRFRPVVPRRDLVEASAGIVASHLQRHPFSISPEDGARGFVRARARRHLALVDSLVDVAGFDRSFEDVVGSVSLFKSVPGPGFANHVLALRGSGGAAWGPGADAGHYEVGGAAAGAAGFAPVGDRELALPVRGHPAGARFGRFAWSATAEYRVPLLLVHDGLGLFPLYADRLSGSVFLDAGNAWGPRLGGESVRFENPRRPALVSAGAEVTLDLVAFWNWSLRIRAGVASRIRPDRGARGYVLLGL